MNPSTHVIENRARSLAILSVGLLGLVGLRAMFWQPLEEQEVAEIPLYSFDLNTATVQELDLIPGVGEKMAADIISLRGELGRFHSIEDLRKVRGIKDGKLSAIAPYVFVESFPGVP